MGEWVRAALDGEIPPGKARRVVGGGIGIAVFNFDGQYFAVADTCTHEEASLSEGELSGCVVECPRHAARFCVMTGEVLALPAAVPLKTFPVKVEDSVILVQA